MKRNIKYLIIFILFICFIIFFTNDSYCSDYTYSFPSELLDIIYDLPEYQDSSYGCFGFQYYATGGYRVMFVENTNRKASCSIFTNNTYGSSFGLYASYGDYIIYNYNSDFSFKSREVVNDLYNYTEKKGRDEYFFKDILVYNNNELYLNLTSDFYLEQSSDRLTYSQILSIYYDVSHYDNYIASVSLDNENWFEMSKEYTDSNNTSFIFYYNIFQNGTYYLRLYDIISNSYIYEDTIVANCLDYDIYFEPDTTTDKPIVAWTVNTFLYSDDYIVYFSKDKVNWEPMNTANQSIDGEATYGEYRYWTRIFQNGTYYFKFVLILRDENGNLYEIPRTEEYFVEKTVDFITVENYMSDEYIFKPNISLSFNEENQSFIVRTQNILLDKALNLNCFYISYDKNDGFNPNDQVEYTLITNWNKMEIDFENNIFMNTSEAYFYFEIPLINAVDTNYKIAFYNYFSDKSSDIVYYDFVYDNARDYVENDLKVHLGITVRLNDFLKNIESKFGILGFPISIIRNFSNKILTIQEKEPIIYFPALYEPFYHNKIFDGVSFNFNSLLVHDSVIFIHEFYLIIVDIILIYLFLKFCIKTLNSFIDKNNNN